METIEYVENGEKKEISSRILKIGENVSQTIFSVFDICHERDPQKELILFLKPAEKNQAWLCLGEVIG